LCWFRPNLPIDNVRHSFRVYLIGRMDLQCDHLNALEACNQPDVRARDGRSSWRNLETKLLGVTELAFNFIFPDPILDSWLTNFTCGGRRGLRTLTGLSVTNVGRIERGLSFGPQHYHAHSKHALGVPTSGLSLITCVSYLWNQ
jgi:hypothetical protein